MKLILIIVSCLLCIYNANAACDVSVLDLVFVIDESGSISSASYQLAKDAVYKMVENLKVGPKKVHVGIVRYSTEVIPFRTLVESDQTKTDILLKIQSMEQMYGLTATGDAIAETKYMFDRFRRPATPKVTVVLTDGDSNHGQNVIMASNALKASKVHLFAVGIGNEINDKELTDIASEPKSRYKLLVSDYAELVASINNITYVVCETNAIIGFGERVSIQAAQNEIRNFEAEVNNSELNNPKASYIEFALTTKRGRSVFSYSFTDPNQSLYKLSSTRESIDENGLKVLYYDILVPSSAKLFYFSIKSTGDGENEYDFEIRKY